MSRLGCGSEIADSSGHLASVIQEKKAEAAEKGSSKGAAVQRSSKTSTSRGGSGSRNSTSRKSTSPKHDSGGHAVSVWYTDPFHLVLSLT